MGTSGPARRRRPASSTRTDSSSSRPAAAAVADPSAIPLAGLAKGSGPKAGAEAEFGGEIRRWFGSKLLSQFRGKKKTKEPAQKQPAKNEPAKQEAAKDPAPAAAKDAAPAVAEAAAVAEAPAPAPKSAKEAFTEAVDGAAPKNKAEAKQRMIALRAELKEMTPAERESIATDQALMAKARTFVGSFEYMSLVTAVGMAAKTPAPGGGAAAAKPGHLSGAQADTFIQTEMGKLGHLKGYMDTAVGAGKKADGFVAVVGPDDWKKIYEQQYKGETVGVDDLDTNAFIANTHPDRPAIIHEDRGTPSTAIHESMHRYSELAVLKTYGSGLNEGMTEYFTRLITDKDGKPLNGGKSNRTNYQSNWRFMNDVLVPLLGGGVEGQTKLAEIYFSGKPELIESTFRAKCTAAKLPADEADELWKDFSAALGAGDWAEAKKHLPPAAAAAPDPHAHAEAAPEPVGAP